VTVTPPLDLDAIRARAEAASPPPWVTVGDWHTGGLGIEHHGQSDAKAVTYLRRRDGRDA
jgi:hypothetical protein